MRLPWWSNLLVGIFISLVSGYIYLYVPRLDGSKNMAMAFFFYIGLIFIIFGLIKFFLNKNNSEHNKHHIKENNTNKEINQHIKKDVQISKIQNNFNKDISNLQNLNIKHNEKHHFQHHVHQNQLHNSQFKQNNDINKAKITIIRCPNCNTRNYNYSNFCHICGKKLK